MVRVFNFQELSDVSWFRTTRNFMLFTAIYDDVPVMLKAPRDDLTAQEFEASVSQLLFPCRITYFTHSYKLSCIEVSVEANSEFLIFSSVFLPAVSQREALRNEENILSRLSHPNIVCLIGVVDLVEGSSKVKRTMGESRLFD